MTKKSLDNSAARSGSGSITRHPAFPAIVALWFTALLGLGGLLIPVALLERLVEVSRIASLVPAVAPPLGITARLIIAVVLGLSGAVLGFRIARRVAGDSSQDETATRSRPGRKTFNVATDIVTDEEPVERGSAHPLRRRRALAVADLGPAAESIQPDAEPQYEYAPAYAEAVEHPVEALDIEVLPPEPGFLEWPGAEEALEEPEAIESLIVEVVPEAIETPQAIEIVEAFLEPEPYDVAEWDELEAEPEFVPAPKPAPAARPSTPLDELDITQLVERFADTVRRRREWLASTRQSQPSRPLPSTLEVESPAPRLAPVAPPQAEEEAPVRRPPFFDWMHHLNVEALDDVPTPGFSIPMHTAAFVEPSRQLEDESPEPEEDIDAEGDDAYGSLIEMKNPFAPPRSDFIRIDDEEAGPETENEPAQELEAALERPDTVNAEESLRAALAKLQQLSGHH